MSASKKSKRPPASWSSGTPPPHRGHAPSPRRPHPHPLSLHRLLCSVCHFLNTAHSRPALFALLLLLANLQGHYAPFLWSYTPRPALLPSLLWGQPPLSPLSLLPSLLRTSPFPPSLPGLKGGWGRPQEGGGGSQGSGHAFTAEGSFLSSLKGGLKELPGKLPGLESAKPLTPQNPQNSLNWTSKSQDPQGSGLQLGQGGRPSLVLARSIDSIWGPMIKSKKGGNSEKISVSEQGLKSGDAGSQQGSRRETLSEEGVGRGVLGNSNSDSDVGLNVGQASGLEALLQSSKGSPDHKSGYSDSSRSGYSDTSRGTVTGGASQGLQMQASGAAAGTVGLQTALPQGAQSQTALSQGGQSQTVQSQTGQSQAAQSQGGQSQSAQSQSAQSQTTQSRRVSPKDPLDDGNDEGVADEGDRITPYVAYHRIAPASDPHCRAAMAPLSLLRNANRSPITSLASLDAPGRRALVFLARYGLGNSLRGFVSAYVYARVAGRTLVRFHGAEHTKVYDTLCTAFKCGFQSIHWDNTTGPMVLYRQLDALNPFPMHKASAGVRESIKDDVPLMVSRSPSHFDGFWRNSDMISNCVYSAFACSSTWCVHSRALHGLLRGPTPALKAVVKQVLYKHVPSNISPTSAGVKGGREGESGSEGERGRGSDILAVDDRDASGAPRAMKGISSMFDVALHMRTRAAAIESVDGKSEELSRVGCFDKEPNPGRGGNKAAPPHQFLKKCLWGCIDHLISELDKSRRAIWEARAKRKGATGGLGPPPRISILLATDNEALRPVFVEKLSRLGDVYFSKGSIVHLSKSASSDLERLPTMAEFYLMAKSHTIIEAGSYVSTFAYFSALFGNGSLASIDWFRGGGCGLKLTHQGAVAPR